MSVMDMAFNIIVIILSSFLAIFLILSIVAVVLVLKLIKSLRAVVAKGEHLVDAAEELGETFKRNAGAVGLVRIIMQLINKSRK